MDSISDILTWEWRRYGTASISFTETDESLDKSYDYTGGKSEYEYICGIFSVLFTIAFTVTKWEAEDSFLGWLLDFIDIRNIEHQPWIIKIDCDRIKIALYLLITIYVIIRRVLTSVKTVNYFFDIKVGCENYCLREQITICRLKRKREEFQQKLSKTELAKAKGIASRLKYQVQR